MKIKSIFSKTAFFFCVLAASFALTTCETLLAALQMPKVSFYSAELAKIDFTGTDLLCKVQVENPNAIEIPFPEVAWELFINGNFFIRSGIRNNERIRAMGTSYVEIPVSLEFLKILETFASLKGRDQTAYRIAMDVKFNLPILGERIFHLEYEGAIPMPQMPVLSTPSMRVENIDLYGADIVVSMNIDNPNVFSLPSPNIAFDFQVNRNSVLRSSVDTGSIAPSSVTPVNFRLSVSFAEIARSVANAMLQRELTTNLDLSVDFGIPAFAGEISTFIIPGTLQMPSVLQGIF